MSEYEVVSYEVKPVEGDEQVELVIHATDGSTWEYGIPYSVSSGRYTFEEVDVLAMETSSPKRSRSSWTSWSLRCVRASRPAP